MAARASHPGELIRDARRDAGLTQQQLALRAGTSQAAISRLERGGPSPSVETLDRLLRVMGRQLDIRVQVPDAPDIDIDEIRLARALPIEQRLERAFAWNAFAARIAGVARASGS